MDMKILFRQKSKDQENFQGISPFSACGIKNCYFKSIEQSLPDGSSTKKRHSHTGYEFHIIIDGKQYYETCDGDFSVGRGYFLAIPKGRAHRLVSAEYPIKKYAFTFSLESADKCIFNGVDEEECICLPIPERLLSNIRAVAEYSTDASFSSSVVIENCIFESVILLLRAIGIKEKYDTVSGIIEKSEDGRVELAKQYISDNIEMPLSVSEVAAYCYISEKHLTRLFYFSERLSPASYMRRERIKYIEELLRKPNLSLGEISRRMGFPNESGFNAFFKKYNGMPPGEYRKMITNGKE